VDHVKGSSTQKKQKTKKEDMASEYLRSSWNLPEIKEETQKKEGILQDLK